MYCRLAILMAEKNPQLSQRQLAKEVGLDVTIINRLYTNKFKRIDAATIETLCHYFDRGIGDLFDMRNPEDIPKRRQRGRVSDDAASESKAA